jgi:hypothetical protein
MPIRDWTRGDDLLFHSFHLDWVVELCDRLNHGVLPSSHYAMSETVDLRPRPGFLDLAEPEQPFADPGLPGDVRSVEDRPPGTRWVISSNQIEYARRAITVREADTHHVVAAVLFVSPQDKRTTARLAAFAERAVGALAHGVHLLIVDLFPPSRRDPQGMHKVIWDRLHDEPFALPPDKPLTLAAYAVGTETVAYVEPVAVGDPLPDMPVFLTGDRYVPCPLEATYQTAWEQFPAPLRAPLEAPPASS